VDTRLPGFSVRSRIEFMGFKGVPNGALAFDNVRVPREYVLVDVQDDPWLAQSISTAVLVGRMFVVSALATGVARRCLRWTRDFVTQRSIDGRKLGYYDEIQRMLASTLAEVYAMDTVAKWCLLGPNPQDRWFELLATKNISTVTAWRIVDRTMSLMGGTETAVDPDVFCTDARDRLAQLWRQLTLDREPDHARLSRAWLTGPELDHLVEH
jgi:alkylation response protein AidB-like acyl-CoA dehydrogenase